MNDKLRHELTGIVDDMKNDLMDDREVDVEDVVALFDKVLAPELEKARILNDKIGHLVAMDIAVLVEKARKWDRFVGIQSCNDCPACPECPCDDTNCPALKIENALTKEPT